MVVVVPGWATSLYPAFQYASFIRTLNSKGLAMPAMEMLHELPDGQSMGTPSDQERPGASPRRKRVLPKPISTWATIVVFWIDLEAAFLAVAFLAAGLGAAVFFGAAFLTVFLAAAFLTAFFATFLVAARVVFFMSLILLGAFRPD